MCRRTKNVLLCAWSIAFLVCTIGAVLINRALASKPPDILVGAAQTSNKTPVGAKLRNLALQPEAFNLSRRLGRRFSLDKRQVSTVVGMLTVGRDQSAATVIRKLNDDGEQVEIHVSNVPGLLTWDPTHGALAGVVPATGATRDLIERIVFDSADQFIAAQLRGASYYTVARNVRPTGVGDDYSGPLWHLVRVDESSRNEEPKSRSPWRVYYINTATGLLDKIVSNSEGITIETQLTAWTEFEGEKVPTQITWSIDGQSTMQYRITQFSRVEN